MARAASRLQVQKNSLSPQKPEYLVVNDPEWPLKSGIICEVGGDSLTYKFSGNSNERERERKEE